MRDTGNLAHRHFKKSTDMEPTMNISQVLEEASNVSSFTSSPSLRQEHATPIQTSALPPYHHQPPFSPTGPLDYPIRRKPLPPGANPPLGSRPSSQAAARFSGVTHDSDLLHSPPLIPFDHKTPDSPTLPPFGGPLFRDHYRHSGDRPNENLPVLKAAQFSSPSPPPPKDRYETPIEAFYYPSPRADQFSPVSPPPQHDIAASEYSFQLLKNVQYPNEHRQSTTTAMAPPNSTMTLQVENLHSADEPKSPGKFSFFRWGSTSEGDPNRRSSPSLSPKGGNGKSLPPAIDTSRANASPSNGALSDSGVSLAPTTPSSLDAIEEEVRLVSADLAASIRREMDLEDLVERLQAEVADRESVGGRRTSDYFSDAGTPVRVLDTDPKPDIDAERVIRKAEQEKAQLRLELLGKVQEEREKRKNAEQHVQELEEKVQKAEAGMLNQHDTPERIRNLEMVIDDAKRRLLEERRMKENFEDLLKALKDELQSHKNERDNLRNEVVPSLRSRVEGLESEASDLRKIMYDHSRMQQELANLKSENAALAAAMQSHTASVHGQTVAMRNQARQSIMGSPTGIATPSTPPSNVSVPLNAKDRESLAERLKDVEAQRDHLHSALKSLRARQEWESRKAKEKISILEAERELANNPSLRKQGRDREASSLRREVDRLRQRAEDALEQKFVCERSLGTLQMDLQRAEQETSTLRDLLKEHDDLVSKHEELKQSHVRLSQQVLEFKQASSVSLQQAYKDLQTVHERSMDRLDQLENGGDEFSERERQLAESNEESRRTIQSLRRSLSQAEVDRDIALEEAEIQRRRAENLQESEKQHLKEERNLSGQLQLSTKRVEELASQVRRQLASNDSLRERLAECIARGEEEQLASAKRINDLQERLKILEDTVLEAQQKAEDAVHEHEDEIRKMKETQTSQLRRLKVSALSTSPRLSPKMPLSPFLKSPNLEWSLKRNSDAGTSKTELLEKHVAELERALADADNEMAEVVGRMNVAQIEVMELQTERDDAIRQTKRLQMEIITARSKYPSA